MGALAKKLFKQDAEYYNQFYTQGNCERLIESVTPHAEIGWSQHGKAFSLPNFREAYEHYLVALIGGTNDDGLAQSWFPLYRNMSDSGNVVIINSFGMDVRKTILKTVLDERQVMSLTVNFKDWDPKDVKTFNQTFGIDT